MEFWNVFKDHTGEMATRDFAAILGKVIKTFIEVGAQ